MKITVMVSFFVVIVSIHIQSIGAEEQTNHTAGQKEIVLTIDDLPVVASASTDRHSFVELTQKLLDTIQTYEIPAVGFVNSGRIASQGKELLSMWLAADLELGNHTYSHPNLNNTPIDTYKSEILKGETELKDLLEEHGKELKYFRYPFLHRGKSEEVKQEVERFLTERGYIIAPVTMDNQEWMFASVYARAKRRNDTQAMERIGREYLLHMQGITEFFESWSLEVAGYQPRHILLIHANALNADYLEALIQMLFTRGYRFISLDEAMKDELYSFKENYIGSEGLSWIHRVALTKGMELQREPREPDWLKEMYQNK